MERSSEKRLSFVPISILAVVGTGSRVKMNAKKRRPWPRSHHLRSCLPQKQTKNTLTTPTMSYKGLKPHSFQS